MMTRLLAVLAVASLKLTWTGCPVDGVATASPMPTWQVDERYAFYNIDDLGL